MAAVHQPLYDRGTIASQVIATDTDTSSEEIGLDYRVKEISMWTKVSSRTDGTFTPKIEISTDGTTWTALKTGSGISTDTENYTTWAVEKDGAIGAPRLRITVTSASTTTGATVEAQLYLNKQ